MAAARSLSSSHGIDTVGAGSGLFKRGGLSAAIAQTAWASQATQTDPAIRRFMHSPRGKRGRPCSLFIECLLRRHERFFFTQVGWACSVALILPIVAPNAAQPNRAAPVRKRSDHAPRVLL